MTITYTDDIASFAETVSVEDAEALLEWAGAQTGRGVDLSDCSHVHAATLQVLMASALTVRAWPNDENLKAWLVSAIAN
jgi:hypothetical protein